MSRDNIFVDKSMLIKEILENDQEAILFTRPLRWGKALNMSMLKVFFQADVDKQTGKVDCGKKAIKNCLEIFQ